MLRLFGLGIMYVMVYFDGSLDSKMRRFTLLLMCTVILVSSAMVLASEFNTDDDTEGWTLNPRIDDLRVKDGALIATIAANTTDPFISVVAEEPWDAIALSERGR